MVSPVDDGRHHRPPRAGVGVGRDVRFQRREDLVESVGIDQGGSHVRGERLGRHPPPPVLRDAHWVLPGLDAAHDLRSPHDGVRMTVRQRRVARLTGHPDPHTPGSLVGDGCLDEGYSLVRPADGAAHLGDRVVGQDRLRVGVDQLLGPQVTARLLVGDRPEHEVPPRSESVVGQVPHGQRHRRGLVEHVDGTAAPHLVVDDLAAEGVVFPAHVVGRHDIGMAHQAQRRRRAVTTRDPGDEMTATWHELVPGGVDPRALHDRPENLRVGRLVPRRRKARTDTAVADQGLKYFRDLVAARLGTHIVASFRECPQTIRHPQGRAVPERRGAGAPAECPADREASMRSGGRSTNWVGLPAPQRVLGTRPVMGESECRLTCRGAAGLPRSRGTEGVPGHDAETQPLPTAWPTAPLVTPTGAGDASEQRICRMHVPAPSTSDRRVLPDDRPGRGPAWVRVRPADGSRRPGDVACRDGSWQGEGAFLGGVQHLWRERPGQVRQAGCAR